MKRCSGQAPVLDDAAFGPKPVCRALPASVAAGGLCSPAPGSCFGLQHGDGRQRRNPDAPSLGSADFSAVGPEAAATVDGRWWKRRGLLRGEQGLLEGRVPDAAVLGAVTRRVPRAAEPCHGARAPV